ncbi:MAG: transketolase, partial [Candidatus Omnitrophota bacterium]
WHYFGWHAVEVDGHDLEQLDKVFGECEKVKNKPQLVIAHTIKGKGISFIENKVEWHGIAPKKDELERALAELDEQEKALG